MNRCPWFISKSPIYGSTRNMNHCSGCTHVVTVSMEIWSLPIISWVSIHEIKNSIYPILWQPNPNLITRVFINAADLSTFWWQGFHRSVTTCVTNLLQFKTDYFEFFNKIWVIVWLVILGVDGVTSCTHLKIKIWVELKTHDLDWDETLYILYQKQSSKYYSQIQFI